MLGFDRRLTVGSAFGLLMVLSCFASCGGNSTAPGSDGSAGATASAGTTASAGSAGTTASAGSAGTTASAGSAGTTASAGNGAGGASTGPACSSITTEAACTARSDCHAISERILCPGSGAPCPFQFKYCSDSNCGPACDATQICVGSERIGGPVGSPPPDPTYACQAKPTACGASIDCTCAITACPADYQCESSSNREILCVFEGV